MVWTCLPFIRSGQTHLARHSERGKKIRQTEEGEKDKADRGRGGKTTSGNGSDFAKSKRAVEDRENWRKLIVKSSMVPTDPHS